MKSIDVFLLTTNFEYESLMEPIGISILSSILNESGYTTQLLEPSVRALNWQQCADVIKQYNPKILAFSILIDLNINNVLNIIRDVKKTCGDVMVIVGGQAVTMNYNQSTCSELFDEVELFMIGESESIISQVVEYLLTNKSWKNILGIGYKSNGKLIINAPAPRIENLDDIPFMDRGILKDILIDHPNYKETSVPYGRGCIHNCTFCSERFFHSEDGKKRLRRRSLNNVFEEIKKLFFEYGMRSFNIEDESFLEVSDLGRKEIIEFCNNLQTLPEKISLRILGRIDCVEKDTCESLFRAGLTYAFLGVDSIVDADLKLFNKGYNKELVINKLNLLLDIGYSIDVDSMHRISTGYITWHPYTTLQGLRESLDFFIQYNNTPKLIEHRLMVFPSTPLKRKIEADGLLLSDTLAPGEFEFKWKFKDILIASLYDCMRLYFNEWSPLRDGIRTLEKYTVMENPNLKVVMADLVEIRKKLDKHFYTFFDNLLLEAEMENCNFINITNRYINELPEIINEIILNKIDRICEENGFKQNIIEGIKEKSLWLCRYRN